MDVVIKGKNVDLTEALREYAQQKIGRLSKYADGVLDATVSLNVIKNRRVAANQIVEVTLHLPGGVLRGEEARESMYAAIDLVTDKLERQLSRFKAKHQTHFDRTKTAAAVPALEVPAEVVHEDDFDQDSDAAQIMRHKQFPVEAMGPAEAVRRMEALGHHFFVYRNQETQEINVVYARNDGHFGLIEPTAAPVPVGQV